MKVFNIILFISVFLFLTFASAEEFSGKIRDAIDQSPVQGAIIYLENTIFCDTTDVNGDYYFSDVPTGTYTIIIDHENYKQKVYKDHLINNTVPINEYEFQNTINEFELFQNYPNPFNPTTTIKYQLPQGQYIRIEIFNMMGQHVVTLYEGWQQAGVYESTWEGKNKNGQPLPSGTYIYRLISGTFSKTHRLTLVK